MVCSFLSWWQANSPAPFLHLCPSTLMLGLWVRVEISGALRQPVHVWCGDMTQSANACVCCVCVLTESIHAGVWGAAGEQEPSRTGSCLLKLLLHIAASTWPSMFRFFSWCRSRFVCMQPAAGAKVSQPRPTCFPGFPVGCSSELRKWVPHAYMSYLLGFCGVVCSSWICIPRNASSAAFQNKLLSHKSLILYVSWSHRALTTLNTLLV
jgi:hypothetical protein